MEHQHSHRTPATGRALFAFGLALISQTALATPGQSQLSTVQSWLLAIGATVITIAFMYCGLQMAFKKAQFQDISHVFFGGLLFGIAPMLAALVVSG